MRLCKNQEMGRISADSAPWWLGGLRAQSSIELILVLPYEFSDCVGPVGWEEDDEEPTSHHDDSRQLHPGESRLVPHDVQHQKRNPGQGNYTRRSRMENLSFSSRNFEVEQTFFPFQAHASVFHIGLINIFKLETRRKGIECSYI